MGQINKIPLGYLNMLGSQTGGKNPFVAAEQVNPTIEMQGFYHAQGLKTANVNYTPAGVGDSQTIAVPEGVSWFVYCISNVQTAAVQTRESRWVNSLENLPNSGVTPFTWLPKTRKQTAFIAGDIIMSSTWFENPLPLVSGVTIRQTLEHAVGLDNQFLEVLVAEFQS